MFYLGASLDYSGYTLIIPSVSVGNVGQLATDLLIAKLEAEKTGVIWHSAIMPLVGGNPFNFHDPSLTTSAEVYVAEKLRLLIIQLRSPLMQKSSSDFVDKLVGWIGESEIAQVFLLTGVYSYTRQDSEISAPSLKCLMTSKFSKEHDILKEMENELFMQEVSLVVWNTTERKIEMHGGGISRRFFMKCIEKGISAAVVMKYCSEGDNIPDARVICNFLNQRLKLVSPESAWESPPSWINMFGNPPQIGLY